MKFLFSVLFSFSLVFGFSQETEKPKVGLVLSGGGAKGMAHIGVLKALENAGIRPDYITGTSMGSVVGGLYAMGYSANQIDTMMRTIDWDLILSNNIPLTYISYEEKEYYTRYMLELFVANGKILLPSGVIEGQMLSEALSHYTWSSTKYKSFDEFPIPFRCIATDVSTGKEIIFKDGPLSEAMRASMAIPTAFAAADLDTTLAVDGGVLNNFPVELVKEMGADIVIGVNVSDEGFADSKEIGSMVGILLQVAMFPSLEKVEKQKEMCDIYVRPNLTGFSTGSFSSYNEILLVGDSTGYLFQEEFNELAKKLATKEDVGQGIPMEAEAIVIGEIQIKGLENTKEQLVLSKLGIHEGDIVTRMLIEEGIRRIYGINNFKKIIYHLDNGANGKAILTIKAYEKPNQRLKAAIHYDNQFSAGILVNYTLRNVIGKNSRAIVIADFSENPRFRLDYLKYTGKSKKYAWNARYDFRSLQIPTYKDGQVQDLEINNNHLAGLGVMSTQSLKGFTFLSVNYEFENYKYKVGNDFPSGVKAVHLNKYMVQGGYVRNTHNDRNYPTKGVLTYVFAKFHPYSDYLLKYETGIDSINLYRDSIGDYVPVAKAEVDELVNELEPSFFSTVFFHYSNVIAVSKKFQLIPEGSLGITLSFDDDKVFDDFAVGGAQMVDLDNVRFMGLNYRELTAPNIITAGFFAQNVLFKKLFLRYGINALLHNNHVPLDELSFANFSNTVDQNLIIGYGARLTLKSIIGPITGGLSFNSIDPHPRIYFAIGFTMNYAD